MFTYYPLFAPEYRVLVKERSLTVLSIFRPMSCAAEHVLRVRKLYKLIFRLHRGMPAELRVLGDNYARDEFKRHKACGPEEARIFLNEWTDYAINLAKQMKPMQQAKRKVLGQYLDPNLLDQMTDDQIVQLYELHKAASMEYSDEQNTSSKDK